MTTLKRFLTLFFIATLSAFTMHIWGADESVTFSSVYSADDKPTVYNGTNFSITFDKGTNSNVPIYKTTGAAVRIYGGGYFEISSTTKTINKIELTFGSGDGTNAITTNGGSFTSNTWTGSATSVRFTIGGTTGHRRLASVAVTYASGGGFTYTITAESNNDSWGTVSGTTTITASPKSGYRVVSGDGGYTVTSGTATVTNNGDNTFSVSASTDCTVRINFEAIPTCAIRFFNNGTQIGATQNIAEGSSPVVPSDPAACDEGYAFVGWWTAELAEDNTTAETWITDFTVSGAQDYYAVFSHPDDEGGGTVTFDFATIATEEGWSAETDNHYDITKSTVNIFVTKGSASYRGRWWSDDTWRIYSGNKITISSTSGDITAVSSAPSQTFSLSDGKATLNASTTIKFTSISVTYGTTYYTTDCGSTCSEVTLTFANHGPITKFMGDASFTNAASLSAGAMPGSTITYSSSNPSKASVNSAGEVTIHDAMATEPIIITATCAKVVDGSSCQKKATASYTLNIYNRVTWSVNGASYSAGAPTTQTTEGGSIEAYPTDPDGSTACGGKTFVGWTTAAYEGDTKPGTLYTSLSSMSGVHITENTTFYAVFAESGGSSDEVYQKITSTAELTTGTNVLIVHHSSNNAMSNTESGIGYAGVSVTPNGEGKITTTNSAIIWTVQKGTTGFFFHQGDNYLNAGESSGGNHYLYYDEYQDEWTLTGSGPYILHSSLDPGYQFEYYSGIFQTFTGSSGSAYEMDFYVPAMGYTDYSTTCGPNIKAQEVEYLTSTKDQTVKSQAITVKGSSLTGATLSANISGVNASLFSCSLEASSITAGVIETTYIISYTPTAFGDAQHTATLTFTDGTTDSDPITLHGRSLPEQFAIVAFDGANYYALDGTMSGEANTVKPLPVTVTAGAVDLCPSQAVYTLTQLETPNENVYLVGSAGRLYGAGSSTGLNTKSLSSTSGTGWLLSTDNFSTYHVTNATTTDRGVMYYSTNNVFGHYKTTNYSATTYYGDIQLLPITQVCTCLPAPFPMVVARANSATITWDAVPGAASYVVTCTGGSAPIYDGCKATISGLTNNTSYTYTVKAVAAGSDCSLIYNGSFTTTDCDDVPHDIIVTPGIKSITVKWSADAATSKICIYSDEECNTLVGSAHTGKVSPATIDGLSENTQYYLKIFAGPSETCESSVVPFLTQTTTVEIAEWAVDHININLNADEATATVLIEDKQEKSTSGGTLATDIFFSKYFEASGFTKLVGLFNGTDHDIDISDLVICGGKSGSWSTSKASSSNYIVLADISKLQSDYGDGHGHIMLPKNTEIILYSMQEGNKAGFSGANCMDKFYSWDDLADNTVENWYRIGTLNASSPQYDSDGHFPLNFSGPHSLALKRNGKIIDIIGAGNSSGPTDYYTQTVTTAHTLGNGRTISVPNDKEGFFCEDGWSPIPQEGDDYFEDYPEGYSTYLSTNRCLLIRANHVVNGDSAVLNNTSDFKTLGSYEGPDSKTHKAEWVGIPIGNDGTSAERDCLSGAQFGYVGKYDYNAYYAKYEEVTTVDELSGKRNDDGTYTIPIPQLDTLSCTMMRVKVYEGSTEKASREYKVPIMIDAATTTAADKYFHSYARETNSADVCKECDVVILSSGTLTKATSDDAKDIAEVRNLTIYPGGKLIVPEGAKYEYTVNSIQFRVQGEQTPLAQLKGDLITKDQQVIVSRRIPNDRYYFFSLPYDCNISDIRWSNGETPDRGTEYQIVEYDGETRAVEGSTKGAPGHWKPAGSVLKAGVGYNIAVNSKYLKELIFPMAISSTNLTNEEDTKTSNKVTIAKHTGSSSINNHNWNLIAHPYVSAFNAYEDGKIKAGYLHCVSPKTETEDAVWVYEDEPHVYLTMPSFNAGKITYEQTLSSTVGTLNPFLAVFVQGADEGDLTFDQSNRKLSAPARHLAAAENEDESIFVGVTLSGNEMSDQANLRIRPDFTNEYQLGYDLQKFTTFYTARPQIYMKPADLQLAFQAVSDSVAKNTWMPMGVYCYEAGTFTFALSKDYPIDEVEAVYLYDKTTGTTTNLLYDTYTINTTKQLYTNTRFSLNVLLNRRVPQVATDIPVTDAPESMTRKLLINGNVYIQRGNKIYDVTGKQIANQ